MSDVRIHTYTAAEQGLLVNSYLLESADVEPYVTQAVEASADFLRRHL